MNNYGWSPTASSRAEPGEGMPQHAARLPGNTADEIDRAGRGVQSELRRFFPACVDTSLEHATAGHFDPLSPVRNPR